MKLLIKSYLSKREKNVSFCGYESRREKIAVGVPQSLVLGLLLFLIYINNLQNIASLKVLNFADDTLLYIDLIKTKIYKTVTNLTLNFKKFRLENSKFCKILEFWKREIRTTIRIFRYFSLFKSSCLHVSPMQEMLWSSEQACLQILFRV